MLRKINLFFITLLYSSILLAQCNPTETIKLGQLNWESGQFLTELVTYILEEGYDCKTKQIPASVPVLENALSQGDIDIIAEQWMGRSPIIKKALKEGTVDLLGNTLKGGAKQGWYIPDYIHDKYPDLESYNDLFKYANIFENQQKQAVFLNCPTGWVCEVFNTLLLRNTGLDRVFKNINPGTGSALDAEITAAYEQKRPLLFYYWQPTAMMAKYSFYELKFPEFKASCWKYMLNPNSQNRCISGFPVSKLGFAVSEDFKQSHADIVSFFEKFQMESQVFNRVILDMKKNSAKDQVKIFLQEHAYELKKWVSAPVYKKLATALSLNIKDKQVFPSWSIKASLNKKLARFVTNYGQQFRRVSQQGGSFLVYIEQAISWIHPFILILLCGGIAWHSTKRMTFTVFTVLGLFLIGSFGLWTELILTVSLLFLSVLMTLLIGLPLGIYIGLKPRLYQWTLPIWDIMQTMPSFVYLIPILMLFGLGKIPAVFATFIYALPPLIRLTALGVRQVPIDMKEVGIGFGSSRFQLLKWVIWPLSKPSILAGFNQAVMMSLSMVVVSSMIGAPGLGQNVLQAIQTLNVGQGIQSGSAIVILAIIVDRITQAYGRKSMTHQENMK